MKNINDYKTLIEHISSNADKYKFNQIKSRSVKLHSMINRIARGEDEIKLKKTIYRTYSKNSAAYRMLKSRALKLISSSLFTINPSKKFKTLYDRAFYCASKNLAASKILVQLNLRKEAVTHAKSALKIALRFQFTETAISSAIVLKYNESFSGKIRAFNSYCSLIDDQVEQFKLELKAENYYQELTLITRYTSNINFSDRIKAEKFHNELKALSSKDSTYLFRLNTFRVGIRYLEFCQNYEGIISLCNSFEKYYEVNAHLLQKGKLAEIALYKLDAALALRNYKDGKVFSETCAQYFNKNALNWLIYLEYYFLLCVQTGNIEEALDIYYKVTDHPKFVTYPEEKKEKWKLFEAYLNFMLPDTFPKKHFNVFRFLNEVPVYSRDKSGYNFAILVAQIILLMDLGNYDKLIEMSFAFYAYVRRHISRKKNIRTYCFAKMLLIVFRYNFDYEKSKTIGDKFLKKLKSNSPFAKNSLESMEFIPYELLWQEILKRLKKNRYLLVQS